MDRGAWQAAVHGVAKSQTLLSTVHVVKQITNKVTRQATDRENIFEVNLKELVSRNFSAFQDNFTVAKLWRTPNGFSLMYTYQTFAR